MYCVYIGQTEGDTYRERSAVMLITVASIVEFPRLGSHNNGNHVSTRDGAARFTLIEEVCSICENRVVLVAKRA